jgi:hypothetical protein
VTIAARSAIRESNHVGDYGRMVGTADWTIAGVATVLVALALVLGAHRSESAPSPSPATRVGVIERRVEALRGLEFRRPVRTEVVSPAQARRAGLADLDRTYPPGRRRADEEVLKLLGLVPAGTDLRAASGAVYAEQVAGYYDTRRKRLALVRAPGRRRALDDMILAHELTHALEDQVFGLPEPAPGSDDRGIAVSSLAEGTATRVMVLYAQRHLSAAALTGALDGLAPTGQAKLPRYLQDGLEFPYLGGLAFVQALQARDGGGWRLVDHAERERPPLSSEQILHPERYLRADRPRRVALGVGRTLRRGWTRRAAGTFGEWDTRELLGRALDRPGAEAAAAGWGGSRFELWRRGALPRRGCPPPCRRDDTLVLGWRWDTRRGARQFGSALAAWLALALDGRPVGPGAWRVGAGVARLAERDRAVGLVLAPERRSAAALARDAVR